MRDERRDRERRVRKGGESEEWAGRHMKEGRKSEEKLRRERSGE